MKKAVWILKKEISQNRGYFILLSSVSLLLGILLHYGFNSYNRIAALAVHENWDADIVVLPKGIGLQDLRQELLSGKSKAFLPEALFRMMSKVM